VKKRYTGSPGKFHTFLQQSTTCGKTVKYVKNVKNHKKQMLKSVKNNTLTNKASTCGAVICRQKVKPNT
jgi:hypothetical protein